MTQEALFGELRSILQQPVSYQTWDDLCDHLDLWSGDALEQVALPYTLDIIHRWPDTVERSTPTRWIKRLLAGEDVAQMVVAQRLMLHINNGSAGLARLLASPHLRNIKAMHLFGIKRNDLLTALTSAQPLPSLRWFSLSSHNMDDDALTALLVAPILDGITSLNLNLLYPCESVSALLAWPGIARLTRLSLSGSWISEESATALAASPHLSALTHLDLARCGINAAGADALAASPHLTNLHHLDLSACKICGEGLVALLASPYLGGLTHLSLAACQLDAHDIAALAASPGLAGLTHLDLSNNKLSDVSLETLAASTTRAGLTSLMLEGCHIDDAGLAALTTSHPRGWTCLDLSKNQISDVGLTVLAASPNLATLETLNLSSNEFNDEGVIALVGSPHLKRLVDLTLDYNRLVWEGSRALGESPQLATLRRLSLRQCHCRIHKYCQGVITRSPHLRNACIYQD